MPSLVLAVLSLALLVWAGIAMFATNRWMAFSRRMTGDRWLPYWARYETVVRFNTRCSGVAALLISLFLAYAAGAALRVW